MLQFNKIRVILRAWKANCGGDILKFSESLAMRMKERCETRYALAKAIGVAPATVDGWLSGATPRLECIGKIAKHYDCTVEEIENEIRGMENG